MLNPKDAYAQWGVDLAREVATAMAQFRQACQSNSQLQARARCLSLDLVETLLYRRMCQTLTQSPSLGQQPRALRLATLKGLGMELRSCGFAAEMPLLKQVFSANFAKG